MLMYSLKLDTSLLDESDFNLEWSRQMIVNTYCDEDIAENWQDILDVSSKEFLDQLYLYARNNLVKMHLFISTPFAMEYKRSIETTGASFIANIGGNQKVTCLLIGNVD